MAYRLVYTDFWNDPKVLEEMTPEDKYFYLYLLTNPYTNMIGVYRIIKKQMAFDLGYSMESVNSLMDRFINTHKLILYNDETKELCIKNYGKYNLNTKGGKPVIDCLKKDLSQIKDKTFIEILFNHTEKENIKQIVNDYRNNVAKNIKMAKIEDSDDTYHDTYNESYHDTGTKPNPKPNPNPYPKPKQEPTNCNAEKDTSHSFPTPFHRTIFNNLHKVTYETWFMDSVIEERDHLIIITVKDLTKKNLIQNGYLEKLRLLFKKDISVKSIESEE